MRVNKNNLRATKNWTTHIPGLVKTVQATDGRVLELGSGFFSTPLLHWLLAETGRRLTTYDSDEYFCSFAKRFQSRTHDIKFVKNWDDIKFNKQYSVALIDHDADRRGIDAIRLKDKVEYIVLHDTEHPKLYGYDEAFKHFKYIYHWTYSIAHTSIVSNFKDPGILFK